SCPCGDRVIPCTGLRDALIHGPVPGVRLVVGNVVSHAGAWARPWRKVLAPEGFARLAGPCLTTGGDTDRPHPPPDTRNGTGNETMGREHAEPAVPADGAGFAAFRGILVFEPAPLLNFIVRPGVERSGARPVASCRFLGASVARRTKDIRKFGAEGVYMTIRAIETVYRGYRFRSRLEA